MTPERRAELLASCNAILDPCQPLTDADIKAVARALKEMLEGTAETVAIEQVTGAQLREKVTNGSGE